MKKLMFAVLLPLCVAACGKTDAYTPPETASEETTRIEAAAIKQGIFISNTSYDGLKIKWAGVGATDDELKVAVEVLKEYRLARDIKNSSSKSETTESAIASLQERRNLLITGKVCETFKK